MNTWAIFLISFVVVLKTAAGTVVTDDRPVSIPSILRELTNCVYTSSVTSSRVQGSCECQSDSELISFDIDESSSGAPASYFTCLDDEWRDSCGPIAPVIENAILSCCEPASGTVTVSQGSTKCEF